MFQSIMAVFPWDLLDEGIDSGLDRLRGEVGIDHLALWSASPPVAQFRPACRQPPAVASDPRVGGRRSEGPRSKVARPSTFRPSTFDLHNPQSSDPRVGPTPGERCHTESRFFKSEGGLLFRPDPQRYQATRIKPTASSWVKGKTGKGAAIQKLAQACWARSMKTNAVVSASRVGQVARRHPETVCKNAFGDASGAGLCLINADVRAFLCCLVGDISSRGEVDAIELADFVGQWFEAWSVDLPFVGAGEGEARSLLASCFCESCRQRAAVAGVDIESAARLVRVTLQRWFDAGDAGGEDVDQLLAEHPPLKAYDAWRAGEIASLLKEIAQASARPIILVRCGADHERRQHQALDYSLTAGVMTPVASPLVGDEITGWKPVRHSPPPIYAVLSACDPVLAETSKLVNLYSQAAETNLAGIQIDHYGALTDPMLDALRQAIRYARRLRTEGVDA